MIDILQAIALISIGAVVAILGGLFGAYVMYKGQRAVPGEKFIGGVPEGQVFSIPDLEQEEPVDSPEHKRVMERLGMFMGQFGGGK